MEVEVLTTKSGYSLDAVVMFRGEKIGVEVDGPTHFVGRSQSPYGKTVLKRRQLHALEGWRLVAIPYWEWKANDKGSSQERKEKKRRNGTFKSCLMKHWYNIRKQVSNRVVV